MRGSLKLVTVAGIGLYVHPTKDITLLPIRDDECSFKQSEPTKAELPTPHTN